VVREGATEGIPAGQPPFDGDGRLGTPVARLARLRRHAAFAGLVVHKARGEELYELVGVGGYVVGTDLALEEAEWRVDELCCHVAPKLARRPPPVLLPDWGRRPGIGREGASERR
jgi:hypothetical protein